MLTVTLHSDGSYLVSVEGHNNGHILESPVDVILFVSDALDECFKGICDCNKDEE